ncbi:30S ribosome-binding factor RbfA [Rhodobacteraceae bacterium]|jgi:ribosome-binding factor A|nr:30S ribosome-binding factor RbfA [Paracoccaceae bacterium]
MRRHNENLHKDIGPTNRQLRVGELVRRCIADILSKNELYEDSLSNVPITVSEVRCSSDLKLATVFVLPLGGQNAKEVVLGLARQKNAIKKILAKTLNLKFVPDLRFLEDLTFDQMDQTNKLLKIPTVQRDTSN